MALATLETSEPYDTDPTPVSTLHQGGGCPALRSDALISQLYRVAVAGGVLSHHEAGRPERQAEQRQHEARRRQRPEQDECVPGDGEGGRIHRLTCNMRAQRQGLANGWNHDEGAHVLPSAGRAVKTPLHQLACHAMKTTAINAGQRGGCLPSGCRYRRWSCQGKGIGSAIGEAIQAPTHMMTALSGSLLA